MTRAALLARIAAATGRRRKTERATDAIVAGLAYRAGVEDALTVVAPFVANQWGGDVVLRDIRRLLGRGDGA